MEVTHIRFARALKEVLGVTDENAYYCGAIYPDSRYLSKLPRRSTHGDHCPRLGQENLSDFEKGWATHLFYDETSHDQLLSLTLCPEGELSQGSLVWQFISAAKVVEDMQSYEQLGLDAQRITTLSFEEFPNEEEASLLKEYLGIQKELYADVPDIDAYRRFWKRLAGDSPVIEPVMQFVQDLLSNDVYQEEVRQMYEYVLDQAKMKLVE